MCTESVSLQCDTRLLFIGEWVHFTGEKLTHMYVSVLFVQGTNLWTCFLNLCYFIELIYFIILIFLVCIFMCIFWFYHVHLYRISGSPRPTACKLVFFHSHLASVHQLWKIPFASMQLHFCLKVTLCLHMYPQPLLT